MTYEEIIQACKPYRKIVVSGPQRSGTRFVSKELAHVLGVKYVDESAFRNHQENKFREILKSENNFSIHCPGMTHILHDLPDDVLVVFIMRDVEDIIASQNRVKWTSSAIEYSHYEPLGYFDRQRPIAEIKQEAWREIQQLEIEHSLEVPYEAFSDSPRWVDKESRKHFKTDQTK